MTVQTKIQQPNSPSHRLFSAEAWAEKTQDDAVFASCLDYVRAHAPGAVEGVFGPHSATWLVSRESALLLGGLRAVVLQIAHPAVAAGVNQSSTFRTDLLGRARRTFTSTYQMIFGDLHTALIAATRLHKIHSRVLGQIDPATSAQLAGQPYRANDPALLMWVWATLVDTSLETYTTFIRPLTPNEKVRYYAEALFSAALMGIPPAQLPATLADFYTYYQAMLDGSELLAGETTYKLAAALFNSPYPQPNQWNKLLTAGLLPPRFRAICDLRWEEPQQRRYRQLVTFFRWLEWLTPGALRAVPAYHQAQARVAQAYGKRPSLYARLIGHCERTGRVKLPLTLQNIR